MMKKVFNIFLATTIALANIYIPQEVLAKEDDKTFGQIKQELADFKKAYEENKQQQQITEEKRKNKRKY